MTTTRLTLIILGVLLTPSLASAQNRPMAGLGGVYVHVTADNTAAGWEAIGLAETQVRTDAELILRRNGIRVLSEAPDVARLWIAVQVVTRGNTAVVKARIDLVEQAWRRRDGLPAAAVTWSDGSLGLGSLGEAAAGARAGVKDSVEKFANEYLADGARAVR